MNCPYCNRIVNGWTGFQEAQKFARHLTKCRKNPANFVVSDGRRTVVQPLKHQGMREALEIRAASGQ